MRTVTSAAPFPGAARFFAALFLLIAVATLSCGENGGPADPDPDQPPSVAISSPADGTAAYEGGALTLEATANDPEDGNLAGDVDWHSDIDGDLGTGASISPALAVGSHTVTASVTDSEGQTASASIGLEIREDHPPSVAIAAPEDSLAVPEGTELTFAADAEDEADGDLTGAIAWSSDRHGDLGEGGELAATLPVGTHRVIAAVEDARGQPAADTIWISVTPPGTIEVSGDEVVFTFDLREADPAPPYTSVTWMVVFDAEDPVIDPDRLVTRVYGGPVATEPVQVRDDNHIIRFGGTVYGPLTTANPIFDPMLDGVFSFGLEMASGTATVATFTACGNRSDLHTQTCDTITAVAPNQAPSVTITAPADGGTVSAFVPITLQGSASDPEEGDLTASLEWASDLDGALGTGGSVQTTLSQGVHTITASVTDAGGETGSASITINAAVIAGVPPPANVAYVTAAGDDRVVMIDLATNTVAGTIAVGADPQAVAFSPDGARAYVASGDSTLSVIDVASSAVTASLALPGRGGGIAVSPDGSLAYVPTSPSVTVIDLVTETVTSSIVTGGGGLEGVAFTPDGSRAFVTNLAGNQIFAIDVATETVHTITAGDFQASDVTVTPDGATTWVTVQISGNVEVYDASTLQLAQTIELPGVWSLEVTPDGTEVWVGENNISADVFVLDVATGQLVRTIPTSGGPPEDIAFSPDGGTALLANEVTGDLTVADVVTGTVSALIPIGTQPTSVAVRPGSRAPNQPPAVTILRPGDGSSLEGSWIGGGTIGGIASDPEDGDISQSIEWSSDIDGDLGTWNAVSVTQLSVGTHTLVASVTDSHGATVADTATVEIVSPGHVALSSTERIFSFDLTSLPPGPPLTSVSYAATFNTSDPVSESDIMIVSVYGDEDGGNLLQTRNTSEHILDDGTAYGPWETANALYDPMLDGKFSFGIEMTAGTASLATFTVCGNRWDGSQFWSSCMAITEVRVDGAPSVTITAPATDTSVEEGSLVTFAGEATDPEDGDLSASIGWSSDLDGALGTGASISVALSEGTHAITASATDSEGQTAHDGITVIVTPGPTGGSLVNGENHVGTISTVGELHTWTFTADAGDYIALSVGELPPFSDFAPWLRLIAPSGAEVGNSFGGLVAQINVAAQESGTYEVVVGTNDAGRDATGSYRITLAHVPKPFIVPSDDQGGDLTIGENHAGSIHVGDLDQWAFTAAAGDYIALSIGEVAPTSDFAPWIRLVSPTGVVVRSSFGALVAQINVTAGESGEYRVIVGTDDAGRDAAGDYRLTLAQIPGTFVVPTGDDGGDLTIGENHAGSIHVGDLDQWAFTAAAGDYIALSMGEVAPTSDFAPWIRLVSPTGIVVRSSSGALVAQINVTAEESGEYRVIVGTDDAGRDAAGDYQLTLAQIPGTFVVPTGDDGGPTSDGVDHGGSIHLGDLDLWTFSAAVGEVVTVTITEVAPETDFTPWIRVVSPSGSVVGGQSGAASAQVTVTVDEDGTFTVLVGTNDAGRDATGDYLVTVTR